MNPFDDYCAGIDPNAEWPFLRGDGSVGNFVVVVVAFGDVRGRIGYGVVAKEGYY